MGKNTEAVRRYRQRHPERKREYERKWRQAHRKEDMARTTKYRLAHPERNRAKNHVAYALKTGRLTRSPCEVCGSHKVDAHHDDYSQPLKVRWLCRKHHYDLHNPRS